MAIIGGLSEHKQQRQLSQKPAAVIATPGRLWDLINSGTPHLQELHQLRFLILDEADRLVRSQTALSILLLRRNIPQQVERGSFQDLEKLLTMVRNVSLFYLPSPLSPSPRLLSLTAVSGTIKLEKLKAEGGRSIVQGFGTEVKNLPRLALSTLSCTM